MSDKRKGEGPKLRYYGLSHQLFVATDIEESVEVRMPGSAAGVSKALLRASEVTMLVRQLQEWQRRR